MTELSFHCSHTTRSISDFLAVREKIRRQNMINILSASIIKGEVDLSEDGTLGVKSGAMEEGQFDYIYLSS